MTDSLQKHAALASLLHERLTTWEQARMPQQLKLLECYQDVMRIPREDDTKGTGAARAKKSAGLFIGSSRNKVRSARAKINDALFGSGSLPFDTSPTNEELAPYADAVEDILTEQFERMKLKKLLKGGVNTLAKYGTGFIFGPFVRKECLIEASVDKSAGVIELKETKYEYDFPYFEMGNTLDVIPDAEARDVDKGLGVFWATMESPHTVAAWKADKRYHDIDMALQNTGDRGNESGSDVASQLRANVAYWHKDGRIKVARFFGKVPKSAMPTDAQPSEETASNLGEMVDVIIIMAGGVVIKVDESPYGRNPAMRCAYEEEEGEMWAVGVAENNAPHQKVTNAAFRLFMEGKGMALLGTASVDRSKFLPTEDFRKFPGKVYQMKPGLSPDERKDAIIHHREEDITEGWREVIAVSEQFSDDDTGITKYTQGDDSSNLNKTASGISMIMSASSLPIKEVIQNIDEMWIEQIVERTIEWNLKYLEVETVRKIHGEEIAAIWQQIKEFGKHSFMDWQATGTASFMQKEILVNKIRAFADFAMSNPLTAPLIDPRELLTQTWDVMQIGRESPILKEEGDAKIPPQVQQQMEQAKQHIDMLEGSLKEVGDKYNELHAGAEDKRQSRLLDRYKAETERLKLIYPTMPVQIAQIIAQEFGLDLIEEQRTEDARDAGGSTLEEVAPLAQPQEIPPEPAPPEPDAEQPQQPAEAGFFTPGDSQGLVDPGPQA